MDLRQAAAQVEADVKRLEDEQDKQYQDALRSALEQQSYGRSLYPLASGGTWFAAMACVSGITLLFKPDPQTSSGGLLLIFAAVGVFWRCLWLLKAARQAETEGRLNEELLKRADQARERRHKC